MLLQFVENFIHFEGGQDRFDQNGGADAAPWHSQGVLCEEKDVVPETRLDVTLQLWQIEVRSGAAAQGLVPVVKKE